MIVHVHPLNDLLDHEMTSACACGPRVDVIEGGMLVVHRSWDEREFDEWDGKSQGGWLTTAEENLGGQY